MIQFASQTFSRPSHGLPEQGCVNMVAEETPQGLVFLTRPPLTHRASPGDGPIRGVLRQKGTFAGSTFAVSGDELYRGVNLLGTITGSGMVRWAATDFQLVVVAPDVGHAWVYRSLDFTGALTLSPLDDPDLPPVSDVIFLSGRWYYVVQSDDEVWFSAIGDAADIQPLSFFTSESKPDATVGAATLGNEAVFFGQESVEFWAAVGTADAPLVFRTKFDKGCLAQASILALDNRLFWIGSDRMIYESGGGTPQRISTSTIEERLRLCDDIAGATAFPVVIDGHTLAGWNIPGQGTFVYGVQGRGWAEWSSYGRDTFRVNCGAVSEGEAYLGDDTLGEIWQFGTADMLDAGDPIMRELSFFIPHEAGVDRIPPVGLQCAMGLGGSTEPLVELNISRNLGRNWDGWVARSIGKQGEYDMRAEWTRLGRMRSPGVLAKLRTSDNLIFTAMGITAGPRP